MLIQTSDIRGYVVALRKHENAKRTIVTRHDEHVLLYSTISNYSSSTRWTRFTQMHGGRLFNFVPLSMKTTP